MERMQAPVTAKTMINRINRTLASSQMMIIKNRKDAAPDACCVYDTYYCMADVIKARQYAAREHGAYCTVNKLGEVIKDNLNLEDFGRDEGLLKPHEYVIDDGSADMDRGMAACEKALLFYTRLTKKIVRYQRMGFQFSPMQQVSDELAKKMKI